MTEAIKISTCDLDWLQAHEQEWSDLSDHASEANIFFDPGYLLPSFKYLDRHPRLILKAELDRADHSPLLIGLVFLDKKRGLWQIFQPKIGARLGPPLLHEAYARETWAAFLTALPQYLPNTSCMILPLLPQDAPFIQDVKKVAIEKGLTFLVDHEIRRAFYRYQHPLLPSESFVHNIPRQRRRLEQKGILKHTVAQTTLELSMAFEEFLTLEASGWKGVSGTKTALLYSPIEADFMREMVAQLGKVGKFQIHALRLNNHPIAIYLLTLIKGHAGSLKIAYDQREAANSPGVQLGLSICAHPTLPSNMVAFDTFASPSNETAHHIWPDYLVLEDLLLCIRPGCRAFLTLWAFHFARMAFRMAREYRQHFSHFLSRFKRRS